VPATSPAPHRPLTGARPGRRARRDPFGARPEHGVHAGDAALAV